jgi:hypothetical protein
VNVLISTLPRSEWTYGGSWWFGWDVEPGWIYWRVCGVETSVTWSVKR